MGSAQQAAEKLLNVSGWFWSPGMNVGTRQVVAARAAMRNPPPLVLDDHFAMFFYCHKPLASPHGLSTAPQGDYGK